jgi:hypothetical protein
MIVIAKATELLQMEVHIISSYSNLFLFLIGYLPIVQEYFSYTFMVEYLSYYLLVLVFLLVK